MIVSHTLVDRLVIVFLLDKTVLPTNHMGGVSVRLEGLRKSGELVIQTLEPAKGNGKL